MTILRKTPKGQTEIETRVHRLLPRLRTALILVDGRRDESELRKLVPGDSEEAFRTLLAEGFVEAVSEAPSRAAERAPSASQAANSALAAAPVPALAGGPESRPPPPDARGLDNRRRAAVRFLTDQIGPMSEGIAVRIEKARGWDDMLPLLQIAQRQIANTTGSGQAAEFARRFIDTPPG